MNPSFLAFLALPHRVARLLRALVRRVQPRMRLALPLLAALLLALTSAACSVDVPPEVQTFSKDYIALVHANELDRAEERLHPQTRKEVGLRKGFEQAHEALDHGAIAEAKLVGFNMVTMGGHDQFAQVYVVRFAEGATVRVDITVRREGVSPLFVSTFRVTPNTERPVVEKTKSPLRYLAFALALAVMGTTLVGFVQCLRSKVRRKWLWCLGMLVGAGQLVLDGSTGGVVSVKTWWFTLLSVGATFRDGSPSTVTLALPAVAILFLVLRRRMERWSVVKG